MHWLRLWSKVLDSRKVQTLPPETFKAWINLLCVASKEEKDGKLPGVDDIAWFLRITPEEANEHISRLFSAGLLERDGATSKIKRWEHWQKPADSSAERVRRWRARQKGAKETSGQPIDPLSASEVEQLKALSYEDYLNTCHWAAVRDFAAKACGGRCSLCNAKGPIHAHHRTYKTMGQERPTDVIGLCGDCHKVFHEERGLPDRPRVAKTAGHNGEPE